jgi:hypothetical protein
MNMLKMQTARDFALKLTVCDLCNTARIVSRLRLCFALYRVDATHTCTPCEVVNASFKAGLRSCTETPKFRVIRHIAEIRGVNTSFYAFVDGWSHVFCF